MTRVLNSNCRISQWRNSARSREGVEGAFSNQALNTLFNYGCRGTRYALDLTQSGYKQFELSGDVRSEVACASAETVSACSDIFITDPPYGDAVKYEEILDFFIAWLRRNPPPEFSDWVWDSRRALAIQGEDENFRRGMVNAYGRMTACMPDDGVQIIMFIFGSLPDTIEDEWIEDIEHLEEMMDQYMHLREQARDAFEIRYEQKVDPDSERWELCSRVLARRDIVERLSEPW